MLTNRVAVMTPSVGRPEVPHGREPSAYRTGGIAVLVLSRKRNEQIVIDDRIVVTVLQIRGDRVRVGIEAPKDVPVHRKEVHEAMKSQESRG